MSSTPTSRYLSLAAASIVLLVAVSFMRFAPPIVTDSDIAVIEIYTDLASQGELRVGPYSRFGWNHPGPLYFYLQAPFYLASSRHAAALFGGAAILNLLAIGLLTFVLGREDSWLAACIAAGCLLLAWRVPRLLASPWTAHVPVLASMTLLVISAVVAAGRARLLPLGAFVGSYITQTHIGYAPLTAALLGLSVLSLFFHTTRRVAWRALWLSAAVMAGLWILPLVEAITHDGGNAAALWAFFSETSTAGRGHSWLEALANASFGLTAVVGRELALPWGGHFLPALGPLRGAAAVLQLVLLPLVGWRALRRGRVVEANIAFASLAAFLVGVWSLTRIPDDILDHEIFWLTALGILNLSLLVASGVRWCVHRLRISDVIEGSRNRVLDLAIAVTAVALAAVSFHDFTAFERRRSDRVTIMRMARAVEKYLMEMQARKPLLTIESTRWSYAAGVLLRLRHAGWQPAVSDDWLPTFTTSFRRDGNEDVTVAIGGYPLRATLGGNPGYTLVFDSAGSFVYALRAVP